MGVERPPELAGMFDRAAARYDARPGYPERVFEVLADRCGLSDGCRVLEVGPGTGQATVPMLDRGARVTAIERGEALAAQLRERTTGRPVEVVVGDFHDVQLDDASYDLFASATAFHWIDNAVGLARAARLVVDGGAIALWWTIWGDPDRPDPLHEALVPMLRAKAPHLIIEDALSLAHLRDLEERGGAIEHTAGFDDFAHESIRWEGHHDAAELRAIFGTFSGWIALPEPLQTELLDDVAELVRRRFGGVVSRPYRTELFTARRRTGG